jgi:hypothetical protein
MSDIAGGLNGGSPMSYKVNIYKSFDTEERAHLDDYDWTPFNSCQLIQWEDGFLGAPLAALVGTECDVKETGQGARVDFKEHKQDLPPEASLRARPLTLLETNPPIVYALVIEQRLRKEG